ncbi:MAG: F0F1 ATP synthase subunit delta [Candidatus Competibacterales bacterium]
MAETTTIARPYARAAFEYAKSEPQGFERWSASLAFAAAVVEDPDMARLLASPTLSDAQKIALLLDIGGERFDDALKRYLQLLSDYDRLALLPVIAHLYEELRAEAERTLEAELVSALAVDDAQLAKLSEALSKRLDRRVQLSCTIDPSLIGGAVIRANDLVIDGSAAGQLARLEAALRQ